MNKKELFNQSLTIILVLCAIIITALVLRREFFQPEPEYLQPERVVENWSEINFSNLPVINSNTSNAPVQIIKFYDYQCPYCKQVQPSIEAVLDKYSDSISIHYAHYPLGSHQYAYKAAIAAECARNQGQFKECNKTLFDNQDQIGILPFPEMAKTAKIENLSTFTQCLENEETSPLVENGMKLAQELQIHSIPTFIINGKIISGAVPEQTLAVAIEEQLSKK